MQGFKKLCQTDRLLSFLAFQETFSNKKAWNCAPLHKVFRKNSHAPILDRTRTFACKFRRIFQIILTVPTRNMDYWHALKQSFAVQTRLIKWSLARLYWYKDGWGIWNKRPICALPSYKSDVICTHSVQCWPSNSAPASSFYLPPWPPQSEILPK